MLSGNHTVECAENCTLGGTHKISNSRTAVWHSTHGAWVYWDGSHACLATLALSYPQVSTGTTNFPLDYIVSISWSFLFIFFRHCQAFSQKDFLFCIKIIHYFELFARLLTKEENAAHFRIVIMMVINDDDIRMFTLLRHYTGDLFYSVFYT